MIQYSLSVLGCGWFGWGLIGVIQWVLHLGRMHSAKLGKSCHVFHKKCLYPRRVNGMDICGSCFFNVHYLDTRARFRGNKAEVISQKTANTCGNRSKEMCDLSIINKG